MHSFHVLCGIQLIQTITTEWEIPINISHYFLRVIAGYPTFIEFDYPIVENVTDGYSDSEAFASSIRSLSPKKSLNWSCNLFPGDRTACTSTITADKCRNNTQFSAGYWQSARSCEKDGQLISCVNVTITNDTCQNAVLDVHNASMVHLVLKDLKLSSTVIQTFIEHYSDHIKPKCCYPALPVVADKPLYFFNSGEDSGCDNKPTLVKFGINTSATCLLKWSVWENADGCPPMDQMRAFFISNVSHICNCDLCEVPLLRQPLPALHQYNSTPCLIPHQATLTFTHANGFINSAYLSYNYRVISNKEDLILISVRTQFFEYSEPCQKSRFELQRGRFHCPSDRTCWKELWFPLQDLPSFSILQIGFAIIIVLLFILTSKKRKRAASINCDCQFAIWKPKI